MLAGHWQGSGLEQRAGQRTKNWNKGTEKGLTERGSMTESSKGCGALREEWKLRSEIFFSGISAVSSAGFGPARAFQNTCMWEHVCTNAQDYPHPAVITSHLMLCHNVWLHLWACLCVCVRVCMQACMHACVCVCEWVMKKSDPKVPEHLSFILSFFLFCCLEEGCESPWVRDG